MKRITVMMLLALLTVASVNAKEWPTENGRTVINEWIDVNVEQPGSLLPALYLTLKKTYPSEAWDSYSYLHLNIWVRLTGSIDGSDLWLLRLLTSKSHKYQTPVEIFDTDNAHLNITRLDMSHTKLVAGSHYYGMNEEDVDSYEENEHTFLTIDDELTLGDYAFSGCNLLEYLSLPEGLQALGYSALMTAGGEKAVDLEIPSTLTSIGRDNFSNLKTVRCHALYPPQLYGKERPHDANYMNGPWPATLIVPDEAVERYRNDALWSKFATIIGEGEATTVAGLQVAAAPSAPVYTASGCVASGHDKGVVVMQGHKLLRK